MTKDWRCSRCGKEFSSRWPGTSLGERGPMHSFCITAEYKELESRFNDARSYIGVLESRISADDIEEVE